MGLTLYNDEYTHKYKGFACGISNTSTTELRPLPYDRHYEKVVHLWIIEGIEFDSPLMHPTSFTECKAVINSYIEEQKAKKAKKDDDDDDDDDDGEPWPYGWIGGGPIYY